MSDGVEESAGVRVLQKPSGVAEHVGKIRAGRFLSARSVEVWVEVGGLESIARRPSPESWLPCAGYGPPEVDPFEETRQERAMTGDWWFGLITGMGICLILWWVVDRHRRE